MPNGMIKKERYVLDSTEQWGKQDVSPEYLTEGNSTEQVKNDVHEESYDNRPPKKHNTFDVPSNQMNEVKQLRSQDSGMMKDKKIDELTAIHGQNNHHKNSSQSKPPLKGLQNLELKQMSMYSQIENRHEGTLHVQFATNTGDKKVSEEYQTNSRKESDSQNIAHVKPEYLTKGNSTEQVKNDVHEESYVNRLPKKRKAPDVPSNQMNEVKQLRFQSRKEQNIDELTVKYEHKNRESHSSQSEHHIEGLRSSCPYDNVLLFHHTPVLTTQERKIWYRSNNYESRHEKGLVIYQPQLDYKNHTRQIDIGTRFS